ncbi:MAG TPA: pseudouridine synthase [Ignavibacteriaceae bacterium]|nr:pseudouridine synthase [Ignavibacteriaceae bacterium]
MDKKLFYYILNKPYGVLSQFTDKLGRKTLAGLFDFPKDVYPVGRLDLDSEGLLLLSNDKEMVDFLLNPLNRHEKEYYTQVEGIPAEEDLIKLTEGVIIEEKKTLPAKAKIINDPQFPPRKPPIFPRKNKEVCWLSVTVTEGRYRQVRKMTAAIGYPTLRLVRVRIKNILLDNLPPGKVRELTPEEIKILKTA